ncbi:MAG: prepilin peptidase [Deltaproteobacteria bacterium]|nr:prepilin peptidase [Deltaproteobacteria bacterium]
MSEVLNYIPSWELILFAAIFGTMWGSFANVVIVRWPRELSVVSPPSHCFSCGAPIKWYDNIPVISYLVLRGRCRNCKTGYSPRYALVELASGIMAGVIMLLSINSTKELSAATLAVFFIWFTFALSLIIIAMIDLEHYLIPDVIALPGIIIGVLANTFILKLGYVEPIVSAVVGYASIRLLFIDGYKLLRGRPGMGLGDAKLMAMIGAFLGYEGALFAIFAGAFQGTVIGIVMVIARRRDGNLNEPVFEEELKSSEEVIDDDPESEEDSEDSKGLDEVDIPLMKARVPFGPFLALGAIEYLFIGDWFLSQYTNFIAKLIYGI